MGKRILSVVVGLVLATAVIWLAEILNSKIVPMPEGFDYKDPVKLREFVNQMPLMVFIILLVGYAAGSFAGAAVATLISGEGRPVPALIVGAGVMIAGIGNLAMIPHPIWFIIVSQFMYLPFAYLAYLVFKKKNS